MMSKRVNPNIKAIIALCAIAFLGLAASATSPALATIGQNFPEATAEQIAAIATLSTLTGVPMTIISGLIAGRKVKYRTLALSGLTITLIGGFMPFFANDIREILIGRAILGIGSGIMTPVSTVIILSFFKGDEIAKQYSRSGMATNIGAIVFQLLGGFLCGFSWRIPFIVYLTVIPVIVIVFFCLPEVDSESMVSTGIQSVKGFDVKKIFTKHVFFWSFSHLIYMMCFYAYVTQTSGIILRNGYGNSTTSAVILSLFTFTGVVGGYFFFGLKKRFEMGILVIGFFINFVSYVALCFSKGAISYTLISCLFGFGYGVLGPSFSYFLGIGLDKDYRAASIAVSTILSSIGSFGSSYATKFVRHIFNTQWDRIQFATGSVVFLLFAIFFVFFNGKAIYQVEQRL